MAEYLRSARAISHSLRWLSLAVPTLLTLACAGVPIATMWHFRSFGAKDFVATKATAVRAALEAPRGLSLSAENLALSVSVKFSGSESTRFEMPLERLERRSSTSSALARPGTGRTWYLFKLSPAGVQAFQKLQQNLKDHLGSSGKLEPKGSLSITIEARQLLPRTGPGKAAPGKVPIELDLELNARDGFYTLYAGDLPLGSGNP